MADTYEPTWASLDAHTVPDWYHDAKLGVFIHWGVYSVPAWSPTKADLEDVPDDVFLGSPYAEWYPLHMYEDGGPTYEYHRETYGADFEYTDFIDDWRAENWDPDEWATFFADVGARYVVLTGEHHDGFPLWDSHYTKYTAAEIGPERDIVGELADAVRSQGLKFAASYHANLNYYQPGFDGPFGHPDFEGTDKTDAYPGPEYVDFMNAKHRELIRKYRNDLLWFDIPKADSEHLHAKELLADYYNLAEEWGKEVLVNNRSSTDSTTGHGDFDTPEYRSLEEIQERKWEMCRGIGHSFGYNRVEGPEDHLTGTDLVHLLVDVVSKNGNLLINVGPRADGTIPVLQREPLEALGAWLEVNGEAIFGTRPWLTAEDPDDSAIRYTWKGGTLYAICLERPDAVALGLADGVSTADVDRVELVGGGEVDFVADDTLHVQLPGSATVDHATTLRIEGLSQDVR